MKFQVENCSGQKCGTEGGMDGRMDGAYYYMPRRKVGGDKKGKYSNKLTNDYLPFRNAFQYRS
jgi:hypothetical protein